VNKPLSFEISKEIPLKNSYFS